MQSPAKNHVFKDREIRIHTSILMIVMGNFCVLLDHLEDATSRGHLRFQGMGHSGWLIPIIKRRCIELLITVNLNLNHWPKQPVGFKELEKRVHKVCGMLYFWTIFLTK